MYHSIFNFFSKYPLKYYDCNFLTVYGSIIKYPNRLIEVDFSSGVDEESYKYGTIRCLSKDGLVVTVGATFYYRLDISKIYDYTNIYKDFDGVHRVIVLNAQSSIRHACSLYDAIEFQTKRFAVQSSMQELTQNRTAYLHVDLEDLQLTNIDRPDEFDSAVQDKESSRTDIDLAENERRQKIVEAEAGLARAEQKAQEIIDSANTQAEATFIEAQVKADAEVAMIESYRDAFLKVQQRFAFTDAQSLLVWFENRLFGGSNSQEAKNKNLIMDFPSKVGYNAISADGGIFDGN